MSVNGRIMGSYVHGIFSSDDFRTCFLEGLGASARPSFYEKSIDAILNMLAEHLETHVDVDGLLTVTHKQVQGASV